VAVTAIGQAVRGLGGRKVRGAFLFWRYVLDVERTAEEDKDKAATLVVRKMMKRGNKNLRAAWGKWRRKVERERKFGRVAFRYLGEKSLRVAMERWRRVNRAERIRVERETRGVLGLKAAMGRYAKGKLFGAFYTWKLKAWERREAEAKGKLRRMLEGEGTEVKEGRVRGGLERLRCLVMGWERRVKGSGFGMLRRRLECGRLSDRRLAEQERQVRRSEGSERSELLVAIYTIS